MTKCGDDVTVALPLFQADYGGSTPTSPLQLRIYKITPALAVRLNELWHSRLPHISVNNLIGTGMHICFGAECGNIWYAVGLWSAPIARHLNDRSTLELRRFAISPDAPRNTASRMLSVMKKLIESRLPHIKKLISYQDNEVHSGVIYKASGWTRESISSAYDWRKCKRGQRKNNRPQAPSPKTRWSTFIARAAMEKEGK